MTATFPVRDGSAARAEELKRIIDARLERVADEAVAAGWQRGSAYRIMLERLREVAAQNAAAETHHTLGGDVLRFGEPKTAPVSKRFLHRVRDFFGAW